MSLWMHVGEILDMAAYLYPEKIAGYKKPKSFNVITEEEMLRTQTGKTLHRVLRERYGTCG